ncbi:terminase gpA endonuclease subunit [Allorhodopirellula heiligendammensis]|uniref:Phage terminase large subunit (GpA) n=1 Tax=Allorhodopirellula heiligendammensis TaxID=2714739 RepID=A0A5C6C1L1_9BACT|nr:terminase gpA endonuclease subunit [Allorhodopirellula heiligendammensis]TWU18005.1 Phage terminase large subunit (GpA) [Allorhodopirellula heiligendammensis]
MASESYDRRKNRAAARDREESAAGKDIGGIPPTEKPSRRDGCERDLLKYLLTYHRESFGFDFSADHLDFIAEIERAILHGGAKAQAMPRGSGKTTIILLALCWAIAYGHRRFVVLIGSEKESATELADDFRTIWETNDRLLADFPEIAYPVRELEGVVQRAKTQTSAGQQTHLRWSGTKLVTPHVQRSDGTWTRQCCVRAVGLLGRIRGMKYTTAAGEVLRPDVVLVEDFQTDESAASEVQCAKRERKIAAGILGLAGPGKTMAAFCTCTVIRWGDAADRILNRTIYPRWKGRRCKLVNKWPTDYASGGGLWAKYTEIRDAEIAAENEQHPKATAFYRKNQKAMDAGADVPWAARKYPHEHSAVEHAVNLRHDNPDSFDAEYQNEPKDDAAEATAFRVLTSDEYCTLAGGIKRGTVPEWATTVTVGIDVQKDVLFWVVVAVGEGFAGSVIDYGAFPKQPDGYFSRADVSVTLEKATGLEGKAAIVEGLTRLCDDLFARRYPGDAGGSFRIERGLVDSGAWTAAIYRWARETPHPVLPCMGFGVGATKKPWADTKTRRGERVGYGWRMPPVTKTTAARRVDIDTNTWKSDLLRRFTISPGLAGRWTLFQRTATAHRMWADHMAAEYPTEVSASGRTVFEWKCRTGKENDFLDATIYAAVAANLAGVEHPEAAPAKRRRKALPKSAAATGSRRRSVRNDTRETDLDANDRREKPAKSAKLSISEMRAAKRRG